jgi:hypothetical protein
MEKEIIMQVKILGKVLGIAESWDSFDDCIQFYDFKSEVTLLPDGDCISFNFMEGIVEYFDEHGDCYLKLSILAVLNQL